VQRQQSSGLGVAEFCRRHGVPASSLFAWKRRLGRQAGAGRDRTFVAVQPAEPPAGGRGALDGAAIELHLGAGRYLVLRRGFDAQVLWELLAVLEGQP
jgi:hypothetical protein